MKKILIIIGMLILLSNLALAASDTTAGLGLLLTNSSGSRATGNYDLTVTVSELDDNCVTYVYNNTFTNGIIEGVSNVTLGLVGNSFNSTYNQDYFICFYVNSERITGVMKTKLGQGLVGPDNINRTTIPEINKTSVWTQFQEMSSNLAWYFGDNQKVGFYSPDSDERGEIFYDGFLGIAPLSSLFWVFDATGLIPITHNTGTIGNSTNYVADVFTTDLNTDNIVFDFGTGNNGMDGTSDRLNLYGNNGVYAEDEIIASAGIDMQGQNITNSRLSNMLNNVSAARNFSNFVLHTCDPAVDPFIDADIIAMNFTTKVPGVLMVTGSGGICNNNTQTITDLKLWIDGEWVSWFTTVAYNYGVPTCTSGAVAVNGYKRVEPGVHNIRLGVQDLDCTTAYKYNSQGNSLLATIIPVSNSANGSIVTGLSDI